MYLNGEFKPNTSKRTLVSHEDDDHISKIVNGEIPISIKKGNGKLKMESLATIDQLVDKNNQPVGNEYKRIRVTEVRYSSQCLSISGNDKFNVKEDFGSSTSSSSSTSSKGSKRETFYDFLNRMSKYDQDLKMTDMGNVMAFLNEHAKGMNGYVCFHFF